MRILNKRLFLVILLILLLVQVGWKYVPRDKEIKFYDNDNLAEYWSPIIFQEINLNQNSKIGISQDLITTINYDGDWDTTNNWDNLEQYNKNLPSSVYYWIIEHDNFIFVGYGFYHPRDWSTSTTGVEHENDFEGVVMKIKLDGSPHGNLHSLITVAHLGLKLYSNSSEADNSIKFEGNRPIIYVESEGHGVYGSDRNFDELSTFVKYDPEQLEITNVDKELVGELEIEDHLSYSLSDTKSLWERRADSNIFNTYGFFKSDNSGGCGGDIFDLLVCPTTVATPPWRWTQNQRYPGELWFEPNTVFSAMQS